MPSTSSAIAIVLAVNWPPHAPEPGEATFSSSISSSSVMRPAAWAPTASKTFWIVTSWPLYFPGMIGAAVEHEPRQVEPGEGHDRAGQGLVAGGERDHRVEEVPLGD